MNRFTPSRFALFTLVFVGLLVGSVASVFAASSPTPTPTSAIVKTRIFNDCPTSTVTVVNNYPSLISIEDAHVDCFGFANLHVWRFSTDGVNEAVFDNNASFRFSSDFKIEGTGNGEGGLQIGVWYSHDADGLFNVRSSDGEIACFGGRLPFYSFTGTNGLRYVKGTTIGLGIVYEPRALNAARPATITYTVDYNGSHYSSGALAFDQANPAEDPPHGLWGILNDARVGGHYKAFLGQGNDLTTKATFSNITYGTTPSPNSAVVFERVFNDCPSSTLVTTNNYPSLVSFDDSNVDCFGFANLHVWQFSENGVDPAIFNNNANFRFETDFKIDGTGNGEGGILVAPWYGKKTDGLFNVRSTDGEIACFGGRLPFYSFTGANGLRYTKGNTIHLGVIYTANGRTAESPATIEYTLSYLGSSYSSGPLAFDQANPTEDPPYGAYGMLNDGAVGGHFKAFLGQGNPVAVNGSFSNIKFSQCLHPAGVNFTLRPHILNTRSNGAWVTAYLTGDVGGLDVSSLRLNGVPASTTVAPSQGHGALKVRFDRQAVAATLSAGDNTMQLTGETGSGCIESSDVVNVISPTIDQPVAGAHLMGGQQTDVKWTVDPAASSMSLLSSVNGGVSWSVIEEGIENTGTYRWLVPNSAGVTMRLALTAVYETDETGVVNQSEYATSGAFSIVSALSVGGGPLAFSLRVPNPASGPVSTTFSLPSEAAAELSVFDIAGRTVAKRDVGGHSGSQSVSLGALPTGVYVVRLSQAGRSVSQRVAVVQ